MNEKSTYASLLAFNNSPPNQTSWPGDDDDDDDQMTFASAYLDNDVTHALWLIVPPVLLVLGCYGNVMTIVVMRAMTMKKKKKQQQRASDSAGCLSVYFTALALSDLCLLCTNFMWYWPEMALQLPVVYFHDLSCTIPFFFVYTSSVTSAWYLVSMTCQRMTSIVSPHRVSTLCTVRRGKALTLLILIASCLANVYIFFTFHVVYVDKGYPACVSENKDMANSFNYLYPCLVSVLPFMLLAVSNSVLIHAALRSIKLSGKMAAQRDDAFKSSRMAASVSSMTITLILTSVSFLLLTLPSSILWMYLEFVGYYEGGIKDEGLNQRLALADTVVVLFCVVDTSEPKITLMLLQIWSQTSTGH